MSGGLSKDMSVLEALESEGRLYVATRARGNSATAHLDDADTCSQLSAATASREITHRGQIPLGVDNVCSECLYCAGIESAFDYGTDGATLPTGGAD